MKNLNRIVVTGIGIANALGVGVDAFWQSALDGKSGLTHKQDWELSGLEDQYFGSCNFTFKDYFQQLSLPFPLKYSQLAMLGCKLALNDARINQGDLPADRMGLIVNTNFGANAAVESYMLKLLQKGPARVSPIVFTKTVANCALGDVARYFNLKGPSSMLLGENSLCYGFDLLNDNKADVMICGGFDEVRDLIIKPYADSNVLLSSKNGESFQEAVLESKDSNKIVLGEGSAYAVLENLDHALQRGANIYAEVVGYASGCDSKCNNLIFERSAADLKRVMHNAVKLSSFSVSDIGLVVGASCLPWQIKEYELTAISDLLGDSPVHYTTAKSKIGETFGSSDLTALAMGALSLKYDIVPGTGLPDQLFTDAPANIDIAEHAKPVALKELALVNSIHIGGNTTSVLLRKYPN